MNTTVASIDNKRRGVNLLRGLIGMAFVPARKIQIPIDQNLDNQHLIVFFIHVHEDRFNFVRYNLIPNLYQIDHSFTLFSNEEIVKFDEPRILFYRVTYGPLRFKISPQNNFLTWIFST